MKRLAFIALYVFAITWSVSIGFAADDPVTLPLRVLLIPSDGGTEEGTQADSGPLFAAVERSTGLHF
ncbi:MAG: hypothetical protein J6386_06210 [Candidatus Synoicihabitans palmerolidicus]|nr:hypothetical protein [Candidatus Synoicihabitans palmerolidicus]